jgi:KTSC domain
MAQSRNRVPHRTAMFAVASSSIAAAGYDCERHALRLCYVGGGTYDYWGVPANVFRALLDAPSKGQFVNWHIKPRYRYTRLNG